MPEYIRQRPERAHPDAGQEHVDGIAGCFVYISQHVSQ
jgi:hypothetical protein